MRQEIVSSISVVWRLNYSHTEKKSATTSQAIWANLDISVGPSFRLGPVNSRKRTAKRLPVWPTASATFTGTDTDTRCCLLRIHFSVWFTQATHTGVFRYEDRCAPHNDVSVNDGPHIRRWSHNITASLCYICLQY